MFRFEDPAVLGLLLLLPIVYGLRWRRGRRAAAIRYSAVDVVRAAQAAPVRWATLVPPTLRALALAAFVVALARPQTGITTENVLTEGIDIVMVLDVSSSMLAEDLEPNRLEAAKTVGAEFVARASERPHRVGRIRRTGVHSGAAHLRLRCRACPSSTSSRSG